MPEKENITRREFIGKTAAGATALSLGSTALLSSRALGANERITMAVIGVGGRGAGHFNRLLSMSKEKDARVNLVAACDVWYKRRDAAAARCNGKGYTDYREILDRKDIDAVVIATPDHWHAKISIDAMASGKDVYCEKPVTLYWREAKEVAAVARRTKRVFQCGAQGSSSDTYWQARRLIQDGAIGKLIWVQGSAARNDPNGDWNWHIDPSANPSNLDWALWLGPAPKRPWSPERYFRFRKYWDYSGGLATDLLYHALAELQTALTPELPVEVSATGGNYVHKEREVPDTFHVLIKYPSDYTICLAATQENNDGLGKTIRGQHATLDFGGPGVIIRSQGPFMSRMTEKVDSGKIKGPGLKVQKNNEGKVKEIQVGQTSRPDHLINFLDCIKTREKCHLDADSAYRVMVAIALSVESYRQKKVKIFDPVKEEVVA